MDMARVLLKDLTKRFGEVIAVNNLSLEAGEKEFLVLLGPSGCGKTTALRCIAGLDTPEERDLYWRQARERPGSEGEEYCYGLPELRPLSPHERLQQHGLPLGDRKRAREMGERGRDTSGRTF